MELLSEDIKKLLLAALLGAVLGIEREYRGKPAGFRTMMLVSLGSALFTLVSYKMTLLDPQKGSDVTRIASNIVTGIGFLGAGIIFRNYQDIKGVTTAATVWAAAAIGMTVAIGAYGLSLAATGITWITISVLHYVENRLESLMNTVKYNITWKSEPGVITDYKKLFAAKSYTLKETRHGKEGDLISVEWTVRASKNTHDDIVAKLLSDPGIVKLEY